MSGRSGLRILMTADAVGGVWQYAMALSSVLAERGHEIILALLGPEPSPAQCREAERISNLRLVLSGLPLDWLSSGPKPVRMAARELAGLAGREKVDVVHCNMPTLAGAADFPAPLVAVTHGCVATWWEAAKDAPLDPDFHWHREMTKQGLLAADAVVAPSASHAALIRRHYSLPALPLVVRNGRGALPFTDSARPPLNVALTIGRQWDRVKNAKLLDQVAASLEVPFLAAGALRGPHGEEVSLDHLQPLGHLEEGELARMLGLRPVFVSAATFEPFGLAVLEAASAGCPLVLSDIPTFRELWDGAALFASPRDADGFGGAIRRLVADPDFRAQMANAARGRAATFTPTAMMDGMLPIYTRLLERREVAA